MSDNTFGHFHISAQSSSFKFGSSNSGSSNNLLSSQTQTLTREQERTAQKEFQRELDDTIYELPHPPRLELGDGVINSLVVEADDILDQKIVEKKKRRRAVLEQIKKVYNFDEIKDAFDEASVPHQLDFSYGGDNENFVQAVEFLSPSA